MLQCHEKGTDFYKQTLVSLVQNTWILIKKWQQWVFSDVMYYSMAFLKFLCSKNVSYFFCLLRCTYFCLNGPAEQTKLLYFLHNSNFNLLLKNIFCHLSHFDGLPLWILKTFFKCSILLFCQGFFFNVIECYLALDYSSRFHPVSCFETGKRLYLVLKGFDAALFFRQPLSNWFEVLEFRGSAPIPNSHNMLLVYSD